MSEFSAIDFLRYKRTQVPMRDRAMVETGRVAIDQCAEAFARKDWRSFDRWLRTYQLLRRLGVPGWAWVARDQADDRPDRGDGS